jgi:hypothetical protein
LGKASDGRRFAFSLVNSMADTIGSRQTDSQGGTPTREPNRHNENALWFGERLTPLPPVRITMSKGEESDWVIQDLEGMVDLSFKPVEQKRSSCNMFLTRWDYYTPFGCYNGMLVNDAGEEIPVHNLWGFGEKLYLRV